MPHLFSPFIIAAERAEMFTLRLIVDDMPLHYAMLITRYFAYYSHSYHGDAAITRHCYALRCHEASRDTPPAAPSPPIRFRAITPLSTVAILRD